MSTKNSQQISDKVWSALDMLRGKYPINNTKLLDLISLYHGDSKLDEFLKDEELLAKVVSSFPLTLPVYVLEFIKSLTQYLKINNCLDPWLTPSSPVVHLGFENTDGICMSAEEVELITRGFPEKNISILQGNGITAIDSLTKQYDLILSVPPMGMRTPPIQMENITTSTDYGSALLLKSLTHLTSTGTAIFLLSPSFLLDDNFKISVSKLGYKIEAIFSIASGAFLPTTNISSYLLIVSAGQQKDVFVAEISIDERINKTIIDNYKGRKIGREPQLGCLVDLFTFKSFAALLSSKELETLVKQIGYDGVNLVEIATKISSFKDIKADEIDHVPNSIYLPKVGNSDVVTSPSNLKIKPQNYYQIAIDETKANASYVANYFNSAIGAKLRKSIEVGAVIQQIPKSNLQYCILYLPDLNTQFEIIQLDSKINQFNYRLDELKRSLWRHPRKHKAILKDLKLINQEEKLEHWIDTLPFPISSILWRYYATKSNTKKVEHLFHFFEALSEFLSMLMLSALVQDKEFYKQECSKWIDKDEKFKEWYLRVSFGNWNMLTARLSKATREYLSDKEKKDFCKSLYGNPDDAFLNMLTNKGIINILLEVAELRNKWKGHGGISSEEEENQRVTILEQQLNELRKYISDGFEETIIIFPSTSSFEDGIFNYNAKELIGARTPFNETAIKSLIPLDRKKLYLVHANQTKPVELLPFIKYVEASDAIYFYTSIESKDVRWVSYHFEKEAELRQPADNELNKAFDFLK